VKFDITDPGHRGILETARSWGVPPSVFLGRRVRSLIEEHDGVRTLVQEPLWTEDDLQAALDLTGYEAGLCPGCKHPLSETTALENEERYFVPHPIRCHRCTATEQAQELFQDRPSASALLIPVELRPPVLDDTQVAAEPVQ